MTATGRFRRILWGTLHRPLLLIAAACLAGLLLMAAVVPDRRDLWMTSDQRGRWLYAHGRYDAAADAFTDPMWRGAALMRAGSFKEASEAFVGIDTPQALYNLGNALVMQGRYDEAVARYDEALASRPDWEDAQTNRRIAALRAERRKAPGADAGDQREGADQIVFDKDAKNEAGQDTETTGSAMNDEQIRALWLKRVQTEPADFLRSRFSYQLDRDEGTGGQGP